MWTPQQQRAFQKGVAVADAAEAKIARLEQLAKYAPPFADRIRDLRVERDLLDQLCRTAIQIDAGAAS